MARYTHRSESEKEVPVDSVLRDVLRVATRFDRDQPPCAEQQQRPSAAHRGDHSFARGSGGTDEAVRKDKRSDADIHHPSAVGFDLGKATRKDVKVYS